MACTAPGRSSPRGTGVARLAMSMSLEIPSVVLTLGLAKAVSLQLCPQKIGLILAGSSLLGCWFHRWSWFPERLLFLVLVSIAWAGCGLCSVLVWEVGSNPVRAGNPGFVCLLYPIEFCSTTRLKMTRKNLHEVQVVLSEPLCKRIYHNVLMSQHCGVTIEVGELHK